MLKEKDPTIVDQLLAKAAKPSADAMILHPFYRGKVETVLKCCVRDFNDFAIWYTPGVAAPCRAIAADPEKVYEYTNKWNTVAVVTSTWVKRDSLAFGGSSVMADDPQIARESLFTQVE